MNTLATALGIGIAVAALGTTFAWNEVHDALLTAGGFPMECPEHVATPYTAEESASNPGLYRVRILNAAGLPIRAEVCIFDGDHVLRLHQERVIPVDEEWVVELAVPVGTIVHHDRGYVHADYGYGGGAGGGGANNRWCAGNAVEFKVRILSNGYHGDGARCVPNRPASQEAENVRAQLLPSSPGKIPPAYGFGAATLGGLIIAAAHWPSLKSVALGLFTRLERPKILDHRIRGDIRALVEADPGIHASAIRARLGLAEGQARHHLDILVREDVLSRIHSRGATHFFVRGRFSPSQMRTMAALRNPSLDQLLRLVRSNPDLTIGELVERMDHTHSSVSKLARELGEIGLVQSRREGRRVRLTPRPS